MTLKARKQHCPETEQKKTGHYWRLSRKEYMHTGLRAWRRTERS